MLSALQGSGTLELGDAKLATLWPGAIAMAAEAALKADPDKLAGVVQQALAAGLAGGQLPLPGTVKLEIADGQLSSRGRFAIDTADGRARGTAQPRPENARPRVGLATGAEADRASRRCRP